MQSGKAAAVKAVFRRDDLYNGQDYDRYALSRFATKHLAPIARGIGLDELQRVGRGTPAVSDEMCARALLALLGVLELTVRPIRRIMPFPGEIAYLAVAGGGRQRGGERSDPCPPCRVATTPCCAPSAILASFSCRRSVSRSTSRNKGTATLAKNQTRSLRTDESTVFLGKAISRVPCNEGFACTM